MHHPGKAGAPGKPGGAPVEVSGGQPGQPAAAFAGGRDFGRFPPEVASVSVLPLGPAEAGAPANANALLRIRFAEGEPLPPRLTLWPGDTPVELRDDGQGGDERAADGMFTAAVNLDTDAPMRARARAERATPRGRLLDVPVFRNRNLIARVQPLGPEISEFQAEGAMTPLIPFPAVDRATIDPERSLLIRNTLVVNDPLRTLDPCTGRGTPGGKWTFRYLMEQMANTSATGVDAPTFVRRWLGLWESDQVVNGWPVPNRSTGMQQKILRQWQIDSGGPGAPLNLDKAPFRLLAIVNRLDLRENTTYAPADPGEGRFVFGLVTKGPGGRCQPELMSIIFEYGLPAMRFDQLQAWAQQWADLSTLPIAAPGLVRRLNPAYGAALEAVTERFARANAAPGMPNGSALKQIRTNEIAFGLDVALPWELREFQIAGSDADAHHLREVTVKQTPDLTLVQENRLADYVNSQVATIKDQRHLVPDQFPAGSPFLGGASLAPNPAFFWEHRGAGGSSSITDREARHLFSLGTCNGCHAGETATVFTHVKPETPIGRAAALSGFMTGNAGSPDKALHVPDPGNPGAEHRFNDLERRQVDLATLVMDPTPVDQRGLVSASFVNEVRRQPLRMVH